MTIKIILTIIDLILLGLNTYFCKNEETTGSIITCILIIVIWLIVMILGG